jgi:hypothetical protein
MFEKSNKIMPQYSRYGMLWYFNINYSVLYGQDLCFLDTPSIGLGLHLVSRINTGSKDPTSVVLAEAIPALYLYQTGKDLR